MLLGTNADRLGIEGSTFKDVATTRWSASAIEYCASLGLIDGAGDGNFYPAGQLTANAFAKILLTAIGYSSEKEQMTGPSWSVNVAALAIDVGLDNGIEDLSWNDVLTREEAAQMALNAICAPLVAYDNDVTIVVGDTPVSFGSGDAYYVTTTLAREQRISTQQLSNTKEYTVEFGERYFPNLRLISESDEFERPSHTWVYENEEIGTYVDYNLLQETYTSGVTGQDLYNLLGRTTIEDYAIYYYVDSAVSEVIKGSNMIRTNTRTYSTTGNGVLTQVFIDHAANDGDGEIVITSINTFLAKAVADYNERRETLSLEIYNDDLYEGDIETTISSVDFPNIVDYVEGDFMLVNVAAVGKDDYEVARVNEVESIVDVEVTRFSKGKYVTVDGEQYDYSARAEYEDGTLDEYNQNNLDEYTYSFYFDQYGYVIGAAKYSGQANYLFMTGYDLEGSHLGIRTATAAAIFLDGTFEEIQVNVNKTNDNLEDADGDLINAAYYPYLDEGDNQYNMWFTYTTNSDGVYTLKPVDNWLNVFAPATGDDMSINSSSVRLTAAQDDDGYIGAGTGHRAYGNDDSVYITAETGRVSRYDDARSQYGITDVNGVYTGVQDVDIEIFDEAHNDLEYVANTAADDPKPGIFAVYDDDLYVIGAVIIGEDINGTENYAYVLDSDANAEYYQDGNYYWEFEAVVDGHVETLTIKDAYDGVVIDNVKDIIEARNGEMFQLKYDADGYVVEAEVRDDTVEDVYGRDNFMDYDEIDPDVFSIYNVEFRADVELRAVGRTLIYPDRSDDDRGLTIVSDAPIIVIQYEADEDDPTDEDKWVLTVEEYSTIAQALDALADSDKFQGSVAAVLNSVGTAEYLVFNSVDPIGVELDDGSVVVDGYETTVNVARRTVTVEYPAGEFDWDDIEAAVYNALIDEGFEVTEYVYDDVDAPSTLSVIARNLDTGTENIRFNVIGEVKE